MFILKLFGDFQLTYQGQVLELGHRPRVQSLLAYLALHRDQPQPRGAVVHALWPDAAASAGRNRLRNLLHQLRQLTPAWDQLLDVTPVSLQWRPCGPDELDVACFDAHLALVSAQADPGQQEQHLADAAGRYVGDLFPGCMDEWIAGPRTCYRDEFLRALEQLMALAEARQTWDAAHGYAARLLQHDPLHEATYCRIMQFHARQGDMAAVMRVYERCRKLLAQELDVEPSETTQALYRRLVTSSHGPGQAIRAPALAPKPPDLVGRDDEWAELHRLWRQVQDGSSRLVVIQGEAGIGKTRLVQDFLKQTTDEHTFAASAVCYAVEGALAFGPVAEWLRADPFWPSLVSLEDEWLAPLSRLLPELQGRVPDLPEPTSGTESLQRQHFFHALAVALLEHGQPVLLCLDDLQWSDQETLDWLHFLLRYETPTPLLVAATLRTDDPKDRARCQPLLRELARQERLQEITLTPLSIRHTTALAEQIIGGEVYPVYAAQLYHETDGNPFFIVETARARPGSFVESPTGVQTAGQEAVGAPVGHLPPKIRALIDERLARLSPLAMEIVQYAAVIGRRFDPRLLTGATGRGEAEIVGGLEELWAQHILRDAGRRRFDFVHDMVRAVAYAGISPMRLRFLHSRVATELTRLAGEEQGEWSGQAARHLEAAGLLAEAVTEYAGAAAHDAKTHAFRQAAETYAHAVRLGQQIDITSSVLGGLFLKWGRMLELCGDYAKALSVYSELDAMAQANEDQTLELEAVTRRITCLVEPSSVHDRQAAMTLLDRGTDLARQIGSHKIEVQLLRNKMVDAAHYGHIEEAYEAGEAAIAVARAHSLPSQLARVLNDIAANMRLSGRQARAQRYAEEARSLFYAQENLPMLADNLAQQAWSDLHQLQFDSAVDMADQCITLCRQIHNQWNMCIAYQTKAHVLAMVGDWGMALAYFDQAMASGHESGLAFAEVMPANLRGDLLRTIGQLKEAERLHRAALAVAEQQAPFLVHSVEAQLAMNAYALERVKEGDLWLEAAIEHQPLGAIGRAWCTAAYIPRAAVMRAETSQSWEEALELCQSALQEAQERELPLHIASLLVAVSRCLLVLGKDGEAEATLQELGGMTAGPVLHPLRWRMYTLLARLRSQQGRTGAARKHLQSAQAEYDYLVRSLEDVWGTESFIF